MKNIISTNVLSVFSLVALASCATNHPQYGQNINLSTIKPQTDTTRVAHTFFLIGDAGNADHPKAKELFKHLKIKLSNADEKSNLIFLGDNIYPYGMPEKSSKNRPLAEEKLNFQLDLAKDFKGKTLFIPGNHDWYSNGIIGLKEQQDYLTEKLKNTNAFLPKNSCGITSQKIGKNIALIAIDSEWFLADWNKNIGINENCDIKTREDFFSEIESLLNKNQNKTIIIAIHHPIIDHGSHGGQYSWKKQIFPLENKIPLPVLGTGINLLRATSGITHQDMSNVNYRQLSERLQTLLADRENVILVSGHDHNLQYSEKGNIKQIISGAGSKHEEAGIKYPNDFSYGNNGYAILKVKNNGNAIIEFYGIEANVEKLLFSKEILSSEKDSIKKYSQNFPPTTLSSVYPVSATKKGKIYQWLWGKNYRKMYSTPVTAPTLVLDTLLGGAHPTRTGGGHQTHSIRLETPKGEYVLRGLKKSGVRFLQSVAFKNQYIINDFQDSFANDFLMDFYTSSNPYTPLAIGKMTDAIGIKHTNPQLFYLPKQDALTSYNKDFGDELYYLEKRPKDDDEAFDKTFSTDEVIRFLTKDEKYKINEKLYIRARLFDMLIGDWDRHFDQWKWEQKIEGNTIYFSPIPKDRDQAFVKYDGLLTRAILKMPALRHMQSFENKISNIKWFNMEAYPMDLAFTKASTEKDWLEQAEFIQQEINDEVIKMAFENLPKEVQNKEIEEIVTKLKNRKKDLQIYATDYYKVLQKTVILTGTKKKDRFEISRLDNGSTEIKIYRMKKSGEELDFQKNYSPDLTKEIWIYGMGNDDVYQVSGNKNSNIKIRMIGGLQKDNYQIQNPDNIKIYDDRKGENTVEGNKVSTRLTKLYDILTYDYRKPKYNFITSLPNLGYNPDDGIMLGQTLSFVKKGFLSPNYVSKNSFITNLYTETLGYELGYIGTFPFLNARWNFSLDTGFSNSKFIKNYYGMGNLSVNNEKYFDDDYYRVRSREFHVSPTINWKKNAAFFSAGLIYETIKIENSKNRYISSGIMDAKIFDTQQFGGFKIGFNYENTNRKVNPGLGMKFDLGFLYQQNLQQSANNVSKIETGLGFIYHLDKYENLNLSTYAHAEWLLSNNYQFFQMTSLGGNKNLRGFRFDRFYGKSSFYQTTDLRYNLGTIKNYFVPISVGIFGGYDYGKVWIPQTTDNVWHTSYGGGLFLNAIDQIGVQASYFYSADGGRLVLGFGVEF